VALNPETPVSAAEPYLSRAGLVLMMTVHPGFGGQKYIPAGVERFAAVRGRTAAGAWLEVDGGVNAENAPHAVASGANCLVAGTYLFGAKDFAAAVRTLRAAGRN
jgi:ribulose-phosphate 3-epimerase